MVKVLIHMYLNRRSDIMKRSSTICLVLGIGILSAHSIHVRSLYAADSINQISTVTVQNPSDPKILEHRRQQDQFRQSLIDSQSQMISELRSAKDDSKKQEIMMLLGQSRSEGALTPLSDVLANRQETPHVRLSALKN